MMSQTQLHFSRPENSELIEIVSPADGPGLALLRLQPEQSWTGLQPDREMVIVILTGRCSAQAGERQWPVLGGRNSVFEGMATTLYVPPGVTCSLRAISALEVAICLACASSGPTPYVVRPEEVQRREVGHGSFRRTVCDIIPESRPAARLVVGETFNDPGAWSSYPPHKHDVHDPPREALLQEVYHYRLDPPNGFGLQRIYSPERSIDEAFVVKDGDTILIPFGYHPLVAAPGYRLYYLWILAGEGRALRQANDPAHQWVAG